MAQAPSFNPMALSPVLYVNPYLNSYVNTVDNNGSRAKGNIIDSATASSGQALATAGTLQSKPVFNGEGWVFQTGAQMTTGSVSDYNFIHTGSDFDITTTVFICPTTSTTYGRALLTNNGFSTTARGLLLRLNSSAGNNSLQALVGNGTASMINLNASGSLTTNAKNTIRFTRQGSTARLFVNGTQVATQTIVLANGVGDAGSVMSLCNITSSTANVYLKDVCIFNRILTATEATKMNARVFPVIIPTPTNVYMFDGDSNTAGRAVNSSSASDLIGNIAGAYAMYFPTTLNYSSWSGNLLLGTNHTLTTEFPATQHGLEMRFGKSMGAVQDCFIIKYGVGSIPLYQKTAGDWNTATASSIYNKWVTNILPESLFDMVHIQRRTPIFRGFTWIHGANDAYLGGTNVSWTRSGTTITVTQTAHNVATGAKIPLTASSDTGAIPIGFYLCTKVDANTFTFVGVNTGATSGTLSYSAGSTYKVNLTNVITGTINLLTNTLKNEVTGGVGYTVNKLRLFFPETRSGGGTFNATSYSQTVSAQQSLGSSFLTDNPTFVGKVLGSTSQSTEDLGTVDTVHYLTGAYDTLGQRVFTNFNPFINE